MSILASSLGALTAASYSTFCKYGVVGLESFHDWVTFPLVDGRRPVYLFNSLVFIIGSAGLASAPNIPSLLFWRFIQAMGGSLGPVLGAAVIGDIFKLEERGGAMGVCFAASKLYWWSLDVSTWFRLIRSASLDQFSLLTLQVFFSLR